jgi:hypothetical protein
LNSASVGLFTKVGSPAVYRALAGGAVAVGVALGLAELDGDADDEGLDFGEADDEAEADGEGEALAPPEFAPASCLAPDACPVPPDAEGLGDAAGLADDLAAGDLDADALDADALGEDEPDGLADGDGVTDGIGVAGAVVGNAGGRPGPALVPTCAHWVGLCDVHSRTCRKRNSAELSNGWICEALLPGIEMFIRLLPCCCTVVPLMPSPLKRVSRIEIAWFMSFLVGTPPWAATAWSVTCVPPCRSRPRPTLNFECQSPGRMTAVPMMTATMTNSSTASAARCTPGRACCPLCRDVLLPPGPALPRGLDGLLGGVTCACPSVSCVDPGA